MFVARSEHIITFDVDDTLILWGDKFFDPNDGPIRMVCPHDGAVTYHKPHERHIGFLKKQHAKGYTVVVWSAGGTKWAESAVKALGIEDYVDIVMAKPVKWVDDLVDPNQVLGNHIYLEPEGNST